MKCKWYAGFEGVCTNGECPYRGGTCPTSEHPEVCRYAEVKQEPELNAEELVTALRICAWAACEGCPCVCIKESGGKCDDYIKRKAADMLEKLAAERDAKKPEWISVKDRLPETPDTYFCCVNSLAFPGSQYVKPLKLCGNGKWWKDADVTHWMPLPELPKEGKR